MKTGKKLGIVAIICAIIFAIFTVIAIMEEPEYSQEIFDVMNTDMELALEMEEELLNNASTLYKIASSVMTYVGLAGIIIAIIAIVKMVKGNEKGLFIPIISLILIIVFFFVSIFGSKNFSTAFQAGLEAGMEMTEE